MELPRQIVVGEKNIDHVGEFLKSLSKPKKVSIISGKNVKKIVGEKIVKMFPNGVQLQNLIEATIIVLKEVSNIYKLKPEHKIDLIVDVLIYTIDNTDAGSLEALDPILKQLIPGVIDNMLQVDEGKLVLHKKNIVEKYLCCKK